MVCESDRETFDRDVSIFFKGRQPQPSTVRDATRYLGHLHVFYENSIVYGNICMYYRISIFQKDSNLNIG